MENKRNRIRCLNDILRDQLDLLAEQSELEGDGGNLAALSREMVNIYQALASSESKVQKEEMVTEIVMDVVGRIEEVRTENSFHTQHENKGTDNSCLIDISRMVRDATERHQSRQEKAATDAAVTACEYIAVKRYYEEPTDPVWLEKYIKDLMKRIREKEKEKG